MNISNVGRAVPTFAVLVLLLLTPVGNWGEGPTVVALVLFAVPPLLTNAYVGMREVDRGVVQAARGMGMTGRQLMFHVELPLSLPADERGADRGRTARRHRHHRGARGRRRARPDHHRGVQPRQHPQVVAGALLVAVFALLVEGGFEIAERLGPAWARGGR